MTDANRGRERSRAESEMDGDDGRERGIEGEREGKIRFGIGQRGGIKQTLTTNTLNGSHANSGNGNEQGNRTALKLTRRRPTRWAGAGTVPEWRCAGVQSRGPPSVSPESPHPLS